MRALDKVDGNGTSGLDQVFGVRAALEAAEREQEDEQDDPGNRRQYPDLETSLHARLLMRDAPDLRALALYSPI
jgi:hypothetical protein